MPIVSKSPKADGARATGFTVDPPPRRRSTPSANAPTPMREPTKKCSRSKKPKKAKHQPTGDYPVGWCRPPAEGRFDGSKPGPGRPRGSRSQDSILREVLNEKTTLQIGGKTRKVAIREVAIRRSIKEGLGGNAKLLGRTLDEARRLYPEAEGPAAPPIDPVALMEMERRFMDAFDHFSMIGQPAQPSAAGAEDNDL